LTDELSKAEIIHLKHDKGFDKFLDISQTNLKLTLEYKFHKIQISIDSCTNISTGTDYV
jgi:hypothetical protein